MRKLIQLFREHPLVVIPQVILFAGLAAGLTNEDFRLIAGKGDNIPIVGMLFLVAFYLTYGWEQALINDRRTKAGLKPLPVCGPEDDPKRHPELLQQIEAPEGRKLVKGGETSSAEGKDTADKVLVWPDLAGREFVSAVICFFILMLWSLVVDAPLEEPSEPSLTPNPSKAPWYFLGLQEMLVYFDPWLAGVAFPSLIIVGLMVIPYVDFNTKSTGYYSIRERKLAFSIFTFGFLMWIVTIIIGTFLRGPGWQIYMPWESWKIPKPAEEALNIWPDWAGLLFIGAYFGLGFALPALLAKDFVKKLGLTRYILVMFFILTMFFLPLKIIMRLAFSVKYFWQTAWFAI
jgi:hypothetical protein